MVAWRHRGIWRRLRRIGLRTIVIAAAVAAIGWVTLMILSVPLTAAGKTRCAALVGRTVGTGHVVSTTKVRGGPIVMWKLSLVGIPILDLPPSCRATVTLSPVPGSTIGAEIWLPDREWNNRYQGLGTGGLSGFIDNLGLTIALQRRYAASSTDTGHVADAADGRWALGNRVAVVDYGWRGIHETAVAAKQIVRLYYGRPARFNYFGGGSNGGRQGMIEAARFPEDYDGIVAGAPAIDVSGTATSWAWLQSVLIKRPGSWMETDSLKLINRAVLAKCDAIDGVVDGVLEDPRRCAFDPSVLKCSTSRTKDCLSGDQVTFARTVYRGPTSDGRYGYAPGSELGWKDMITGGLRMNGEHLMGNVFLGTMLRNDAKWDVRQAEWDRDLALMKADVGGMMDGTQSDLSKFRARGGKLIMYQGWSDPVLPPSVMPSFFDALKKTMGAAPTNGFARLYMAPGLNHVVGGAGPNILGQLTPGGGADAKSDVGAALEAWVERGVPPGAIIARKYGGEFKQLIVRTGTPSRTRPLCPYPQVARWIGTGDTDDARNFRCAHQNGDTK